MLSWELTNALVSLLIPPGSLLLVAGYGLILSRRRPRGGKALIGLAMLALYVLSTDYAADRLLQSLEPEPRDPLADRRGQAIIVLGGGKYYSAPEYGGADTVKTHTLLRLRYAARLHHITGKPILVTGGSPEGSATSEATAMKIVLENEFKSPVTWTEDSSNTTLENARLSRRLLNTTGVRSIYLVTHAWHMPRAKLAFEHAGFKVIPAPTGFTTGYRLTVLDFMPSAYALYKSSRFMHEVLGSIWYRLKFQVARWF
jgi:uncharacterized SAM-binding protein YcdF (DUF218 family)